MASAPVGMHDGKKEQKPCRILVLDDEPDILDSMASVLAYGIPSAAVTTSASPTKALVYVQEGVDIVITDYRMPEMNGIEFSRRAKAFDTDLPIIMVTAYPGSSLEDEAHGLGLSGLLRKPLDPMAFLTAVKAQLQGECLGAAATASA